MKLDIFCVTSWLDYFCIPIEQVLQELGIIGESSENNTRYFQEYGNSIIGESLGIICPGLPGIP